MSPEFRAGERCNDSANCEACGHPHKAITLQGGGLFLACTNPDCEFFEDTDTAPDRCPDCGERGERAGHMGCMYPANHD